ncbi:hypothetical protein N7494_002417 [Penicillium frequentans]|uniref:C3H1-type domain-containing protein n=1 Tax=Penicillium frequentans TaxID=3151616 RepID=A0AAD6D3Y5_9EURO|nr:hypothetical protein N7494_002417 [Penicillium glabrum]
MLRESDIDSLNNHLASLSQENQRNHENLQGLLNQFKNLLDDYSSLKSDYEEVKEGREKYKRQARGQERNPFVLVLVDGDGYLFKEHFLKAGSEGGVKAARELSDSVRELMHSTMGMQADSCRIMVRVYANILGLSKALARAGMVGHEARSLSPFTSSFTRAQDLFDFIDAAEKKEGSDFKIREMFRLFVDLNQCRHIYFAGCHDTGFTSLLTPYRGSDRITLIKAASFHREFEDLKLPIRELPSVFMSTPLAITKQTAPVQTINTKVTNTTNGIKPVCKHFQKGICKFGVGCNKQHVPSNQQLAKSADSDSPSPKQLWSSPTVVGRSQEFLTATLPTQSLKSEEFIPINKDGDRLDTYCPHPSPRPLTNIIAEPRNTECAIATTSPASAVIWAVSMTTATSPIPSLRCSDTSSSNTLAPELVHVDPLSAIWVTFAKSLIARLSKAGNAALTTARTRLTSKFLSGLCLLSKPKLMTTATTGQPSVASLFKANHRATWST